MSEAQALAMQKVVLAHLRRVLETGNEDEIAEARQLVREFYEMLWG